MHGHTGNLTETFTNLVLDFNAVYNLNSYTDWGNEYLHPTSQALFIQKVDDPGQSVKGPRQTIIDYLNSTQTTQSGQAAGDCYPQFSNVGTTNEAVHTSYQSRIVVGDVTPGSNSYGIYYNTYANYQLGNRIEVTYTLRFELLHNTWYLITALVAPI
jgi:hypothetical protein